MRLTFYPGSCCAAAVYGLQQLVGAVRGPQQAVQAWQLLVREQAHHLPTHMGTKLGRAVQQLVQVGGKYGVC